jgi:hypothetical protein
VAQYIAIPGTRMNAILLPFDEAYVNNLSEVPCPECLDYLEMYMPDPDRPHLLIGTCNGCTTWILMDIEKCSMIKLPMNDLFEDA